MKNFGIIALSTCIVCFLISITGCDTKPRTTTNNTLKFDSIHVVETYHLFNDETKPACDFSVKFIYPQDFANKEILQLLQNLFVTEYFGESYSGFTPQEAVSEYKEQYLANYKSLESDYTTEIKSRGFEENESIPSFSYYEHSESYIHFNEGNILSFVVHFTDYTGGAHGASSLNAYIADLTTGKLLQGKNIFKKDSEDKIRELILHKLMEENQVATPEDLNNVGFFDVTTIIPNDNILVDNEGITFIYNQYEIAPYVMGIIEVALPYATIGKYIDKQCPLAQLADGK